MTESILPRFKTPMVMALGAIAFLALFLLPGFHINLFGTELAIGTQAAEAHFGSSAAHHSIVKSNHVIRHYRIVHNVVRCRCLHPLNWQTTTSQPMMQMAPSSNPTPTTMAPTTPTTSTINISIKDMMFQPGNQTVMAGTTVVWMNNDAIPHTVTSDNGAFDSGIINPGQTFRMTFSAPGTFTYHCNIHPSMHGSISVSSAGTSLSTPTMNNTPNSPPSNMMTSYTFPDGTSQPVNTTPHMVSTVSSSGCGSQLSQSGNSGMMAHY